MNKTQIILMIIGEAFFLALFFYILYIIGGMARGIKQIIKKINELEKKLETK